MYARGLARVGARVHGVGDTPRDALPGPLKEALTDYLTVPRILDEADVMQRVTAWLRGRSIERVLTNWEPLVVLAARLRERWDVPGMSVDVARGFRDKKLMKDRVEAASIRTARSARASSAVDVRAACETIGFPVVVKPIAGAGSADTHRVDDDDQLERVLNTLGHVPEVTVEEFVVGDEYTYDTLCIAGEPVFENVAQYFPNPLVMRTEQWVSPITITHRDMTRGPIPEGVALGRRVLEALRMHDGFTHMEWFATPDGEVVFSEIGCRPGGAHLVDQMNYTCDTDLFLEWARIVCHQRFEGETERKYNCAVICKRAEGEGRITRIEGLEALRERLGDALVSEALLPIGAPRRNWKNTLLSDGHLIVRHPDWDRALELSRAVASDLRLYAG